MHAFDAPGIDLEVGNALQEFFEGDARLLERQVLAQADVLPPSEVQVGLDGACRKEAVGIGELPRSRPAAALMSITLAPCGTTSPWISVSRVRVRPWYWEGGSKRRVSSTALGIKARVFAQSLAFFGKLGQAVESRGE